MNFFSKLLIYPALLAFRQRERLFGYKSVFKFLPKAYSKLKFIIHMDSLWIRKGFFGFSIFHVPDGQFSSGRFDPENAHFQGWIGTYYITNLFPRNFKNNEARLKYLMNSAVIDQSMWLKVYGAKSSLTRLKPYTVFLVDESKVNGLNKELYYGEIETYVDDYYKNTRWRLLIQPFSVALAGLYNKKAIPLRFFHPDTSHLSKRNHITLFGYLSVTQISNRKFIINYACGDLRNKHLIKDDLRRVMEKVEILSI